MEQWNTVSRKQCSNNILDKSKKVTGSYFRDTSFSSGNLSTVSCNKSYSILKSINFIITIISLEVRENEECSLELCDISSKGIK